MAKKSTFSPAAIDALRKGLLADPQTPGLALEALPSGKKRWRYRRLVAGTKKVATLFGGLFPAQTMAGAREWAHANDPHRVAGRVGQAHLPSIGPPGRGCDRRRSGKHSDP